MTSAKLPALFCCACHPSSRPGARPEFMSVGERLGLSLILFPLALALGSSFGPSGGPSGLGPPHAPPGADGTRRGPEGSGHCRSKSFPVSGLCRLPASVLPSGCVCVWVCV